MTHFYELGTAGVTNGSKTVTSVGAAIWLLTNVKKGDVFQTDEIPPIVIETDPEFDATLNGGDGGYKFNIGFEYQGATNASKSYKVIRTSSEWGSTETVSEQTSALIQGYAAASITEEQLADAVEDAQSAEASAEAAFASFDAIYLGAKAADPVNNNQGGPLTNGMVYLNTVTGLLRLRNSGAWTNMLAGQAGAQGIGAGVQYAFASSTTYGDPGGPGNFRANNSDHSLATLLWLDSADVLSVDMAALIVSWGIDEDASIKGTLYVVSKTNRAIFRVYSLTGAPVDKAGYYELPVSYVAGAGTLAAAAQCELVFIPSGAPGAAGEDAPLPGIPVVFSTTTTDADPGTGTVRANNATFGSITQLFFDNADANAVSIVAWLNRLDDVSNSTTRGRLHLQSIDNPADFMDFDVIGAVVDGSGYQKVPVFPIDGAIFPNATNFAMTFAPAGPSGTDGTDGTGSGISFNFDTSTVDSNPTNGGLRANASDLSAATKLYVSKTSRAGQVVNSILQTFDDSNNPGVKGILYLQRTDEVIWSCEVTAVTDATGYVKLDIQNPTANPSFANGNVLFLQYSRSGQQGGSGSGTGNVLEPDDPVAIHEIAAFALSDGTKLEGTGKFVADFLEVDNNFDDVGNKTTALDTLFQEGATIAAAATLDLTAFAGPIGSCTGNTNISAVVLGDGDVRILRFAGIPTIEVGASLTANNGGSNYTVAAGDVVMFVGRPSGVVHAIVFPVAGTSPGTLPSSYLDADGTLAANSDSKIATQKAVKTYVDGIIAAQDAMVFKGVIDCSGNPNYPAASRGWTYRISVAGKIGGASGVNVEAGDILICLTDGTSAGDQATVGTAWSVIQANLDGAMVASSYPTLVSLEALTLAADKGLYATGADTLATFDLTGQGRTFLAASTQADQRTALGVSTALEVLALAYPVGCIYFSTNSTNPATSLGFGTWSAFGAGRVPVGFSSGETEFDTDEETGGAKTHTLTTAQLPAHGHTFTTSTHAGHTHTVTTDAAPDHTHGWAIAGAAGSSTSRAAPGGGSTPPNPATTAAGGHSHTGTAATSGAHSHTGTTDNAGSGSAHNNLQPYIVVRMWKRTA